MASLWQKILSLFGILFIFIENGVGIDKELLCGACKVLVNEINYAIEQVDPKKTIQVGSFRVDPKGSQKRYEIPYARSETHLTELLETICDKSNEYGISTHKASGRKFFIRISPRKEGDPITMTNVQIGGDTQKRLKYTCETIIEDHEDDIVSILKNENIDPIRHLCLEKMDYCGEVDLKLEQDNSIQIEDRKADKTDNQLSPESDTTQSREEL